LHRFEWRPDRPGGVAVKMFACLVVMAGCGDNISAGLTGPVAVDISAPPAQQLSSYRLFSWSADGGFTFNDGVVPYDVNTALFSDYALKQRAIYVPDGQSATYDPEQAFEFPVGSVIVKSFYFPADFRFPTSKLRMIETRLMVRHADGWHGLPYVWSDDQRDAVYTPAGKVISIPFIDATGASVTASYQVPTRNDCELCHALKANAQAPVEIVLIGVKARHLNRTYDYGDGVGAKNQLDHFGELGVLQGAPVAASAPAAYDFHPLEAAGLSALGPNDLEPAARSYLDINCAHCHNPEGIQGMTSQLFLNHDNNDPFHLGICKRPGSAGPGNGGFTYDIVPGSPDTSILYFRMSTRQLGAMMPLIGRSLTHERGAELLHAWIAAMPPDDCQTAP
jgi:uncharacterized repeat protein (TIGR03806 family)